MTNVFASEPLTHVIISRHAISEHFHMMIRELAFGCLTGLLLFILFFSREIISSLRPYFLYIKLFVQIVRRDPTAIVRSDSPIFRISSNNTGDNSLPSPQLLQQNTPAKEGVGSSEQQQHISNHSHVPPSPLLLQKIILDKNFHTRLNMANVVRNIMIGYVLSFLFVYNCFGMALRLHLFPCNSFNMLINTS